MACLTDSIALLWTWSRNSLLLSLGFFTHRSFFDVLIDRHLLASCPLAFTSHKQTHYYYIFASRTFQTRE